MGWGSALLSLFNPLSFVILSLDLWEGTFLRVALWFFLYILPNGYGA